MTSTLATAILSDTLRRESRSLLQYMEEVAAWMPVPEQPVWAQLTRLIVEDRQVLATLAGFLARQRIPLPYIGSFPEPFTALNFSSLDYLLSRLVDEQHKSVTALERDMARLLDPEAAAALRQFLDVKRRHLLTLKELATKHPATPASRGANTGTIVTKPANLEVDVSPRL
jgi:hypothetical protein